MNYDIRQLCNYFKDIHSRYYIDTSGSVYTSLSPNVKKVMIDGKRTTVTAFVNNTLPFLNKTDKQIERMPFSKDYFVLYDGTILQRLKTRAKENGEIVVSLVCINERKCLSVSRLVAGTFVQSVDGMEVHHIDRNRANNRADNLLVMSFEEHRGKGNYKPNHNL